MPVATAAGATILSTHICLDEIGDDLVRHIAVDQDRLVVREVTVSTLERIGVPCHGSQGCLHGAGKSSASARA